MDQGGLSLAEHVLLGGAAGSFAELCTLPALVVRTRMQVQGTVGTANKYRSFPHALMTIIREEGLGAFYKGAAFNVLMTPFARGLYIGGLELSRRVFGQGDPVRDFLAGTGAQLVSSLAYVPRDIVMERCAIDGQLAKQVGSANSSSATVRTIMSREGLRGFYRAYVPHQVVWVPFNGIFFSALGEIQSFEAKLGVKDISAHYGLGVCNTFLASGLAALLTNPIDVVKTRLQVAGANPELFANGVVDCVQRLWAQEGPRGFFAGLQARFMYVGPGFAICGVAISCILASSNFPEAVASASGTRRMNLLIL
eukprot:g66227.t1